MLPPIVRTLLSWASFGVAVGVVASLATVVVLRAEPDAVRVPEVLIIVPIPLGLVAGLGAGSMVASGRGGTLLVSVGLVVALLSGAFAPLAPAPIVFALAGVRLDARRWRRTAAAVTVVVAAGIGLVGVPIELSGSGAIPRGLGLGMGMATGLVLAWLAMPARDGAP